MKLGIFARTFTGSTLDAVFAAVASRGFEAVQFNMLCAGLESMPAAISDDTVDQVRQAVSNHRLTMCGLSATFNTIHPDQAERTKGIDRFRVLAAKAGGMGTDMLTLCTGTRSTRSMWEYHPDNSSRQAYRDLVDTILDLLAIADEYDLRLGIEPEIHNVIDSAEKASRLLSDIGSPRLRIIMDPANLLRYEDLPRMDDVLRAAFDILGNRISLAHAKDLSNEDPPRYGPAGTGCLNYQLYIRLLHQIGYEGPLVLHSLSEQQTPAALRYLKTILE